MMESIKGIYREFGLLGFYKGISPMLVAASMPMQLVLFGAYGGLKEYFKQTGSKNETLVGLSSAVVTAFTASAFHTPVDAKRVRDTFNMELNEPYRLRNNYRGFSAKTTMAFFHNPIVRFGTDYLKEKTESYAQRSNNRSLQAITESKKPYTSFVFGMMLEAITQVFTTPLDVIKTKMMSDYSERRLSFWQQAKIVKKEGMLFNSLGIRKLRLSINSGLMLSLIDVLRQKFQGESDSATYRLKR